jgi:hypothetical protein
MLRALCWRWLRCLESKYTEPPVHFARVHVAHNGRHRVDVLVPQQQWSIKQAFSQQQAEPPPPGFSNSDRLLRNQLRLQVAQVGYLAPAVGHHSRRFLVLDHLKRWHYRETVITNWIYAAEGRYSKSWPGAPHLDQGFVREVFWPTERDECSWGQI